MKINKLYLFFIFFLFLILLAQADYCDDDLLVYINIGIDANFVYQPTNPKVEENILFIDSSNPNIAINWTWDFGDGEISYLQSPTHLYSNVGTYQIKLIVLTDGGINDTVFKNITILNKDTSGGQSPPAQIPPETEKISPTALSNGPYYGVINKLIYFNGSLSFDIDGDIVNYTWDLGDGNIKYGQFVNHTYKDEGNYSVKLNVKDNDGLTDDDYTYSLILKDTDMDGWDDNIEEICGTNPLDPNDHPLDFDGDGTPDCIDTDDDNDGWIDNEENQYGTNSLDPDDYPLDTDNDDIPDIIDTDDDNDGLLDEIEISIGSNPKNPNDIKEITNKDGTTYFLIDTNGDHDWDYIYNPITKKLSQYLIKEQKIDLLLPLIIAGVSVFVIIIVLYKKGILSSRPFFIEKFIDKIYYFSRRKLYKTKRNKYTKNIFYNFVNKKQLNIIDKRIKKLKTDIKKIKK